MTYINEKRFALDPQILYNNCNTNNLHGAYVKPEHLSKVGQYKKILAGSILGSNNRLLARANIISPYAAGSNQVVVDNPWAFLPGDVLYEIGDSSENYLGEQQAVSNATQIFGTVDSIDAGAGFFTTTVTPSAIAVGDIFTLKFEEVEVKVTATTTDVADLIELIKQALAKYNRPQQTSLEYVTVEYTATNIVFTAKEVGIIFTISTSVVGSGAFDVLVASGAGTLTITPDAGNSNHSIGAKIGVISDRPLGIIAHTYYVTDDWGLGLVADFAAYDMANVYKKALPYLDGSIVSQLPRLQFIPTYGQQ